MDIFDRIDDLLQAKGWSRSELMRRIGLTATAISKWQSAESIPEKRLASIANALDTSVEYLQGKTGKMSLNSNSAPTPEQSRERERALKYLGVIKDDGSIDHDLIEVAKVFLKSYQEVCGKGQKD